jgi:hypothetical protein
MMKQGQREKSEDETSMLWVHVEGLVVALHGLLILALFGQRDTLLNTARPRIAIH